jgi:hypothetical protein
MARSRFLPLAVALVLLMIDSAIELAFISSMVGYLHRSGANQYPFEGPGGVILVNAKPRQLLLNEGHTSNGASGTALILISFGGFIVLWLQGRRANQVCRPDESPYLLVPTSKSDSQENKTKLQLQLQSQDPNSLQKPSSIFLAYTVGTVISFFFVLSALAFTFAVTNQSKGQSIDVTLAAQFQGHAYPALNWTPGNWTKALLALPLTSGKDVAYLTHWLHVIEGWKWNLIPLLLISLVVASLSVKACLEERRGARDEKMEGGSDIPR